MGPTGGRRSVRGVSLLPLVLLLAVGRGPIGHLLSLQKMPKPRLLLPELDVRLQVLLLSLQKMPEPRLLLPELDVRLQVLLAIFAPLRRVTALLVLDLRVGRRGRPR